MPLSKKAIVEKPGRTVHVWGLDKSGKSQFSLSAPKPCLINFDRAEDFLLQKNDMGDILRDRIIVPTPQGVRRVTPAQAKVALTRAEGDIAEALKYKQAGACDTVIFDGGTLFLDIITIVTLDEADNPNKTFRYADRNAYIENLFTSLNESGMNVIWTSKAKPVWMGDKKMPGMYEPDCHQSIPYSVDVNLQMVSEVSPAGQNFYGVIGTNAFKAEVAGVRMKDMTWDLLMVMLGLQAPGEAAS